MSDSQQSTKKMICLVLMGLIILAAVSVGIYFLYDKWYPKDKDGKASAGVAVGENQEKQNVGSSDNANGNNDTANANGNANGTPDNATDNANGSK